MATDFDMKLTPGRRIGPFSLRALIGSGGMGDVWLARHEEEHHLEVAIKVIGANVEDSGEAHESFAREARAVAGLSHRGIVDVYDYGLLGASAPFLVMEYAPRGSLERLLPVMTWELARAILLEVMDGLAHAHARGIVHKDLKPGNVLLKGRGEVSCLLTDFGVAHALAGHIGAREGFVGEDGEPRSPGAGTPAYMPPEQLLGHWRDFGPWTDLYALGCMAWEMVTGAPPFMAESIVELATQHLFQELPRLHPRFDVPEELEHWLRRLLRKHTWERYPSAADAAWVLRHIPAEPAPEWDEVEEAFSPDSEAILTSRPSHAFGTFGWGDAPTVIKVSDGHRDTEPSHTLLSHAVRFVSPQESPRPLQATGELPSLRPPWPEDWRDPRAEDARVLAGAGLGIFGLRELPLIGREAERDALWGALGDAQRGRLGAIFVRGDSGVGKSRLVEWLAVRAQEVGQCVSLRVSHSAHASPGDGITRAIAHHLQVVGLDQQERAARIEEALVRLAPEEPRELIEQEASALGSMIASMRGAGRVAALGEAEQRITLASVLRKIASRRALLLWIDDAQWGASSLAFLEHALTDQALAAPILFALTVRDDLLPERPREAARIERLTAHARCDTIEVAPLDDVAHRALIQTLLGFDDALADRIAARTSGNPLFAVQLVGDWIARGLLVPSGGGFRLVDGARVELPDDLHTLWRQRIGRMLAQRFPGAPAVQARKALELAATLGLEIDQREWEAACMLADVAPPPGLLEVLYQQRLARALPGGWTWVHGMLRESIERVAHEAERQITHHVVCMDMLRTLYGEHAMGHAERVARHAVAAGRFEEALAPLIDASYHEQVSGRYSQAEESLRRYEELLERLRIGEEDIRWARGQVQRFWLDWTRGGASDPLRARVDHLSRLATDAGWEEILGECCRWRGLVARFEEGATSSLKHLERARGHYAAIGDEEGQARCLLSMAVALRGLRALDRAETCLIRAVELASRSDFFVLLPRCFGNLAEVSLQRGDLEQAEQRFARAVQVASDTGDRKALAFAVGGEGELAVARGELDLAAAKWSQAETIFVAVGSSYARVARVHLAAIMVARGGVDEGYLLISRVLERSALRDPMARAIAHLTLATCAGSRGAWAGPDGWDAHMSAAVEELSHTQESRYTFSLIAASAGAQAREANLRPRARQADALARHGQLVHR